MYYSFLTGFGGVSPRIAAGMFAFAGVSDGVGMGAAAGMVLVLIAVCVCLCRRRIHVLARSTSDRYTTHQDDKRPLLQTKRSGFGSGLRNAERVIPGNLSTSPHSTTVHLTTINPKP